MERHSNYLGVRNLFKRLIRTNSKSSASLGRDSSTSVGTCLQNTLTLALARVHAPLVDRTVHTARDDLAVVLRPDDAAHFAVVALEVAHVLEGVGSVELNNVAVHGSEQVSSVTELALKWYKFSKSGKWIIFYFKFSNIYLVFIYLLMYSRIYLFCCFQHHDKGMLSKE